MRVVGDASFREWTSIDQRDVTNAMGIEWAQSVLHMRFMKSWWFEVDCSTIEEAA